MRRFGTAVLFFSALAFAQQVAIPPVKTTVDVGKQPVTITATGVIEQNHNGFRLDLAANLSDLQQHTGDVLKDQLDRSDACGERLTVERATLVPQAPSAMLTAWVHYERWACVKALGRKMTKRLVAGNGTVPVKLTPGVENGNQVTLTPEVGRIEADGSLGEVLQSPQVADKIRDKIRDSILRALQKGSCLEAALPPAAQSVATIRSTQFADGGSGALILKIAGEVHVSPQDVQPFLDQIRHHSSATTTN